jgi:hypothetical protein
MSLPVWSKYGRIYSINDHVVRYRGDFDCLLLTEREVGSFAKLSEKFGYFGHRMAASEPIEIDRIIAKLKIARTKFHSRVFGMFGHDETGLLPFHDLLLVVWNVCTIDILSLGTSPGHLISLMKLS